MLAWRSGNGMICAGNRGGRGIHEAHAAEPVAVAVVYGAGHMPAVIHGLLGRYGYQPQGAEWLTIFDF
jgi:hypothetical protein